MGYAPIDPEADAMMREADAKRAPIGKCWSVWDRELIL
jgi:hypothetical protein